MSLSDQVRILGRGKGRSRSLTQDEAETAMAHMLSGDAAPEAIGALLMLLRMKGETAEEIAGFSKAAQTGLPGAGFADLDWPCYAAGRTRGAPLFLMSAKLVSDCGFRVVLHGWNGADTKIRDSLDAVGIPVARTLDEAQAQVARAGIVYLPLEQFFPALFDLLNLRDVFGLRSCINTVCRMLNPSRAGASVQGVFHPSYRLLQADAALLLGWRDLTVIKGGGGEFERHAGKLIDAFGLRNGQPWEREFAALMDVQRRLANGDSQPDLWRAARLGDFEQAVVLGTAELALETLNAPEAKRQVQEIWQTGSVA